MRYGGNVILKFGGANFKVKFLLRKSEGEKRAFAREVAPYGADVESIAEGN